MGQPVLPPKAWTKSAIFCTTPFTWNRQGEWRPVRAQPRSSSGRMLPHQFCPFPRKNCGSGLAVLFAGEVDAPALGIGKKRRCARRPEVTHDNLFPVA